MFLRLRRVPRRLCWLRSCGRAARCSPGTGRRTATGIAGPAFPRHAVRDVRVGVASGGRNGQCEYGNSSGLSHLPTIVRGGLYAAGSAPNLR